jgi:hypothetical protein
VLDALGLLDDLAHGGVVEFFPQQPDAEVFPSAREGQVVHDLATHGGVHPHEAVAGTAEHHALEALAPEVVVGERGLVDFVHWVCTRNLDVGAPSGVDVLPLLQDVEVDGLDQLFPLLLK